MFLPVLLFASRFLLGREKINRRGTGQIIFPLNGQTEGKKINGGAS
jgi:hypothetical protein